MKLDKNIYIGLEQLYLSIERRIRYERENQELIDLTTSEISVLLTLRNRDYMSMKEISETLGVSSSTPTRIVDGLVAQDMVQRESDPEDRRKINVSLSDKGSNFLSELLKQYDAEMGDITQDLSSEEKQVLAKVFHKIAHNLKKEALDD